MDTRHSFLAQDQAGNRYRVLQLRETADDTPADAAYQLEDGSRVRRVDNDTFQIVANGAYVSLVRE